MAERTAIRPVTRDAARDAVRRWHSHHAPHTGDVLRLGAFDGDRVVGVVVLGRPSAPALDDGVTWEVTRLAVGPDAPHCTASRLLGAAWRTARGAGIRRLVSYTRQDEAGTCYRAAGWVPVALVRGRPHTTGNRGVRWLPGLYTPSSEIVDRVRWEIGPEAATSRVRRDGGRWTPEARHG